MNNLNFQFVWIKDGPDGKACTMRGTAPGITAVHVIGSGKTKDAALKDLKRRSRALSKAIKQAAKDVTL